MRRAAGRHKRVAAKSFFGVRYCEYCAILSVSEVRYCEFWAILGILEVRYCEYCAISMISRFDTASTGLY